MTDPAGRRPIAIDPDDVLETPEGRIWTPERNDVAWARSYAALEAAIAPRAGAVRVILVCGIQGAGKSHWIASQPLRADTVYFDAALPGIRHPAPGKDHRHRQAVGGADRGGVDRHAAGPGAGPQRAPITGQDRARGRDPIGRRAVRTADARGGL